MKAQVQPGLGATGSPLTSVDARMLGWIGRLFGLAILAGLGVFGGCWWPSSSSATCTCGWSCLAACSGLP